jgi:streptolysin S family bacteriocin protoxin
MFNNPKDIPFAVGIVWSTYYMVRIVPTLPRPPLRLLAKLGAAVGMAMGVRIGVCCCCATSCCFSHSTGHGEPSPLGAPPCW